MFAVEELVVSEINIVSAMHLPIIATRKAFFIAGFSLASWAPLIPLAKQRLQVENGTMGAILLAFGLGSLLMMPLSGMLAARFGCRRIFTLATILVLVMLPALVSIETVLPLAITLFLFGAGIGAMDVVVNIHAVITEKQAQKPIMSGFHALFSLGGFAGAGIVSLLLTLGTTPLQVIILVVLFISFLMVSTWSGLTNYTTSNDTPFFVLPKGSVIILGLLCFIAYIMEGSMLDWSGILLLSQQHIAPNHAGLGYTLFAIMMTVGRVFGDKAISHWGAQRVFINGSFMAIFGFAILVANGPLWTLAIAFMLIGLGLSNIAPMLFTVSGKQTIMPEALAVAAVSTLGYSGILLGPALIGGIAHMFTLPAAFICVTLMSTTLIFCIRLIKLT
ncbi:MFS transporter [Candidatus Arsenophonus nilaparvatae]|uniref:MFS transporter n=1 Tax=Candidatus Arsenophonus nilaparvatae TaxID=1247023 RepID=UPI0016510658|nr:MFS transporter [Candidatus Arsenophonus nilaparvatae]